MTDSSKCFQSTCLLLSSITVPSLRSWLSWRRLCWMIFLIVINSRHMTCPPYLCLSPPRTSHADISIRTAPARNYRVCIVCVRACVYVCEMERDSLFIYLYNVMWSICNFFFFLNINHILSSCVCACVLMCVHMCRVSSHHWYRVWWWFDEWRWVGGMVSEHAVLFAT